MNFKLYFLNSVKFSIETFLGEGPRGVIFIVLGISLGILSLFNPDLTPLPACTAQLQLLLWGIFIGAWFLVNAIFIGYEIRILRGGAKPPGFDHFNSLLKDGIESELISCVWIIPAFIFSLMVIRIFPLFQNLVLAGFIIGLICLLIPLILISQFVFARTRSFWTSFNASKIRALIRNLGLKNYFFAYGVGVIFFVALYIIDAILKSVLSQITSWNMLSALSSMFISFLFLILGVLFDKFLTSVFENSGVNFSTNNDGNVLHEE